ncbi:MAG: hypothetical protein AB7J13_14225 [Pyrinomonadaceae bacterium]
MPTRLILLSLVILVLCFGVNAQVSNTLILPKPTPAPVPQPIPAPGRMTLLPEYVHARRQGKDTVVGDIKGSSGLVIGYDIGFLAGNWAWRKYSELLKRKVGIQWYQEQKVNGLTLYLVRGEDKSVYATFPETCANFYARDVHEQHLADFLLMIMTYRHEPRKDVRLVNGRPTC